MFEQLVGIYSNWQTRHRACSARRATRNELSKLSDHDLKDIGISRGDINYISEKHYKKEMKNITHKKILHPLSEENENLKGWTF